MGESLKDRLLVLRNKARADDLSHDADLINLAIVTIDDLEAQVVIRDTKILEKDVKIRELNEEIENIQWEQTFLRANY